MKQTKFVLLIAGVVGVVACFLPYYAVQGHSMSFWDFHQLPTDNTKGVLSGPSQVYIAMVGFALAAVMAVIGMAKLHRWHAIVGALGCAAALASEHVRRGFSGESGLHTEIGGKLLFISAVLGIVGGVLGAAKPER